MNFFPFKTNAVWKRQGSYPLWFARYTFCWGRWNKLLPLISVCGGHVGWCTLVRREPSLALSLFFLGCTHANIKAHNNILPLKLRRYAAFTTKALRIVRASRSRAKSTYRREWRELRGVKNSPRSPQIWWKIRLTPSCESQSANGAGSSVYSDIVSNWAVWAYGWCYV